MTRRLRASGCRDFRNNLQTDRRGFLQAGLLGLSGLSLSQLLEQEAMAGRSGASVTEKRSVIILWMRGGPSHFETWDPKPEAPEEYRGEFGVTSTNVPGIRLCDYLPACAKIMDKWSIVRSLHHKNAGHSAADQICFTGHPPGPIADENVHPSVGSVVSEQQSHLNPRLPTYVMIPRQVPGTNSAYLGVAHKPFETQVDPANPGPFRVRNFSLPQGVSLKQMASRRALLGGFDQMRRDVDRSGQLDAMDKFKIQAWEMLTSREARDAFDLDSEPQVVRERYGFMPAFRPPEPTRCGAPAWSQRLLLARRLVEAGVRLVTVDLRWWDTHVKGFESLKDGFLPRFDRAHSALIEDLDQRGLLKSTLVLAWGEFGRTPRVNTNAGRDHYPNVFSAALAGGPVKGGRVVGESDSKGAFPKSNPKSPQDVLALVYRYLGVDVQKHYEDGTGRPIPVLPSGKPIDELC